MMIKTGTLSFFLFLFYKQYSLAQSQCTTSKFYGEDFGVISEYELIGNSVINNGIVATYPNSLTGIAIASNLIGGPANQTLYGADYNNLDSLYSLDSNGWNAITIPPGIGLLNGTGSNNMLYFQSYSNFVFGKEIISFDGAVFDTVYSLSAVEYFTSFDIASDANNNIYFIINDTANAHGDFLNVVSPAGILIHQYAISLNTFALNGMFISGNTLYLAYGQGTAYNYVLLPVTFGTNNAIFGTAIPFLSGSFDLASCNPGLPLGINTIDENNYFSVFPNPFNTSSDLNIELGKTDFYSIDIFDIHGRKITTVFRGMLMQGNQKIPIKLPDVSSGIYVCKIQSTTSSKQVKIIKN